MTAVTDLYPTRGAVEVATPRVDPWCGPRPEPQGRCNRPS